MVSPCLPSFSPSKKLKPRHAELGAWMMFLPVRVTARLSGRRRRPPQVAAGGLAHVRSRCSSHRSLSLSVLEPHQRGTRPRSGPWYL